MNTRIPFQFKVLRYIHDSFTGEFLNVGLALYAKNSPYFRVRLLHKYARITNAFPGTNGEHYHKYITSLQNKFDHLAEKVNDKQITLESWPPEYLDELLSQILPPDDSAIQFAPAQGGMAGNLDDVFNDLYYRLVETYIPVEEHLSRNEREIWNLFSKPLRSSYVIGLFRSTIIEDVELEHAWKNGHWKALQPISFDLQQASYIQNKSRLWLGTNLLLNKSPEISKIYYLLGKPRRDDNTLQRAYSKAKDLLASLNAKKVEIIEEDEAEDFANAISAQIKSDVEHSE